MSHLGHNKFALISAPDHVDITLVDVNPEVLRIPKMTGVGSRAAANMKDSVYFGNIIEREYARIFCLVKSNWERLNRIGCSSR